jgi:hypothetical protein
MANLVLMITCETSIAHRAGALGRPVWILLKQVPDWRWLLDREDRLLSSKGARRLGRGFERVEQALQILRSSPSE